MQFFTSALCVDEYETPAAVIIYEWASSGLASRDQRCSLLCPVVAIAGSLPDLGAPSADSFSLNLPIVCVAMWYLRFGKHFHIDIRIPPQTLHNTPSPFNALASIPTA
jgi:hypothetical protein